MFNFLLLFPKKEKELNMINIISAIGSLGTFIMALFYFVSVSVQLYQMKISFIPALGFNQILLIRDKDQRLNLKNFGPKIIFTISVLYILEAPVFFLN